MTVRLDRQEAEILRDALISAFTIDSFEQMLYFKLGKNYQDMVPQNANRPTAVFNVIRVSEMEGWTDDLVNAAHDDNPGNPLLKQFTQQYIRYQGAAPTLEKIIEKANSFLDVAAWRYKLERIERQVCSIEIGGGHMGTGFLIADDMVMTNYHVIEGLLGNSPRYKPQQVQIRFDFKVAEDGSKLNDGIRYPLQNDNWLVDRSRYSQSEADGDFDSLPALNELDYAVLRAAPRAGSITPGKEEVQGSIDKTRGWITFPTEKPEINAGEALFIVQHPDGKSLKMALATNSVIQLNGNGTRLRHKTNTEGGSSGSACFNSNWDLIALHHAGDPNWHKPEWNQAVPIWNIRENWQATGKLEQILSGAPAPAPAGSAEATGDFSADDEAGDMLQG